MVYVAKKKARKKSKNEEPIWPVVVGVIVLIIVVIALLLVVNQPSEAEYPTNTTFTETLNAVRGLGVNEIIAYDLAADFSSGNYTLAELKERYIGFEEDIDTINAQLQEGSVEVVALVNGEAITRNELTTQMSLLPEGIASNMNQEQVLNQMVDERLLMQEAESLGITPSAAEIEAEYQSLLERGQMTEQQLLQNLATYGLEKEDLQAMLRRQLTIDMLFEQKVNVNISEDEVRAFYNENPELFVVEPQVTVRHVLVSGPEANATAHQVLEQYQEGTDFCSLVQEYSEDQGSMENCGEYTFGRGFMVPPFEEMSYQLEPGQSGIVQTSFGYHVVNKINETEPQALSFEEAREEIMSQLMSEQRLDRYQSYIATLREKSEIVNYLEEENASAIIVPEATATSVQIVNDTQPVENETVEPIEEPVVPVEVSLEECLVTAGAQLYTASWAPQSLAEAEKYPSVEQVDCTMEECPVQTFPAWEINGEFLYGSQTEASLSEAAGC